MTQNPQDPNPQHPDPGGWQPPPSGYGYQPHPRPRLMRVSSDKAVAGVCSGLARSLNLDVTLVRVLAALAIVFSFPVGLIAYVIAWAVMPEDGSR